MAFKSVIKASVYVLLTYKDIDQGTIVSLSCACEQARFILVFASIAYRAEFCIDTREDCILVHELSYLPSSCCWVFAHAMNKGASGDHSNSAIPVFPDTDPDQRLSPVRDNWYLKMAGELLEGRVAHEAAPSFFPAWYVDIFLSTN